MKLPFGISLRHLLFDLAGGMRGQTSHLKRSWLAARQVFSRSRKDLDVLLSFEDMQAAGLPLGSGMLMVIDQSRDIRDVLIRLARFFAHESCGKCYPCQLGTQRQHEILVRQADGNILAGDQRSPF